MILVHQIFNPGQKSGSDVVIFLFEISQFGKSTIFYPILVVSGEVLIGDFTVIMVMGRVIKWTIDFEIVIKVSHVIGHNIHHHIHSFGVAGTDKVNEVLFCSEVIIQFVDISSPIAMISSIAIVDDRRNPDGIKAHALYVVKMGSEALIPSSTVISLVYSNLPKLEHMGVVPSFLANLSVST